MFKSILFIGLMSASINVISPASSHAGNNVIFDIESRKNALQKPAYAAIKRHCLAQDIKLSKPESPLAGLAEKKGYGGDRSAGKFVWQVMVLGGRALAGDNNSAKTLANMLVNWANNNALLKSDQSLDSYYGLKRTMLPVIVNYAIVADQLTGTERMKIEKWIDSIVRPLDKNFGGADVDRNNHRQLADATLMAWGAYKNDKELYNIGVNGFANVLKEANQEGALALETRRGSRAVWYMRHVLSSLSVIAATGQIADEDLYKYRTENGTNLDSLLHYFLNIHFAPVAVLPASAENLKPGSSQDYLTADEGYLHLRGHGRHYMAFAEILAAQHEGFATARLQQLMTQNGFKNRPLIDEYSGGNTTCFFMEPK